MSDLDKMTVTQLQEEQTRVLSRIGELDTQLSDLRNRLTGIRSSLEKRLRPAPEPRVSDHALMRYLERVYDLDFEAMRNEILSDKAKEALKMGATAYTHNGVKFIAKDGVLVTVVNKRAKAA